MARVTTKTGVANLSAILLKIDPVQSIDPADKGSKFAKLANRLYDTVRREVLKENTWNHALKRAQLPASADAPLFGSYSAKFLLPADYIRVATLGDEDNPELDYKVEDGYLLCNLTAPINLRYVYDQTDITKWDEKFLWTVATLLAARVGYMMSGNRTLAKELKIEYLNMLSDSSTLDGQESPPTHRIRRSKWKAAKEGRSIIGSDYKGRVVT